MNKLTPLIMPSQEETLFSWHGRIAAVHAGSELMTFLHDLRISAKDIETGKNRSIERLADVTGVETRELLTNHISSEGRNRSRFKKERFGSAIMTRLGISAMPIIESLQSKNLKNSHALQNVSGIRRILISPREVMELLAR